MARSFDDQARTLKTRWEVAAHEVKTIDGVGQSALQDTSKIILFKGLFRTLEKYYSKSEDLWDKIQELYDSNSRSTEFPTQPEKDEWKAVRSCYRQAQVNFAKFEQAEQNEASARSALAHTSTTGMPANITVSDARTSSHLPRISIPKFDGTYSHWPKFRDTFTSIVDRDEHLSDMEKFHYLASSISGNAAPIISSFSLEERNYKLAWKALTDVYDNKRLLANSYMNQLMQFKPHQGKANVGSLMQFLSKIADTVSALKLLQIPDLQEFMLFYLAFRCLDSHTKEQFEFANKAVPFPTFDNLIKYVRDKCIALQLSEGNFDFQSSENSTKPTSDVRWKFPKQLNSKSKPTLLSNETKGNANNSANVRQDLKCYLCPKSHSLRDCSIFNSFTPEERVRKLKYFKGCKNCLNSQHNSQNCRSKWHCRFCPNRHHSMLHVHSESGQTSSNNALAVPSSSRLVSENSESAVCNASTSYDDQIQIVLGTALVQFMDSRGQYQTFRAVVDSGSQHSFMTSKCFNKLGLSMQKYSKKISAIGGSLFEGAKGKVFCTLLSADSSSQFSTDAIVVKNITNYLPISPVPYDIWRHYVNFSLADPKFWEPAPIDFLLGADLYGDVMLGNIETVRDDFPKLFASVFGHVVMGKFVEPSTNLFSTCLLSSSAPETDVAFQLSKFWELEEVPSHSKTLEPEDAQAEEFFQNSHYRTKNGRYVVRLPFKEPNLEFPSSYFIAKHRFANLETKLKKTPLLSSQYHDFMTEYLTLGHMQPTYDDPKFVIPHHCVSKEDRGETKIRVVFDGSVKTSQGSLNEHLLVGPALQNDLRDILLNFRAHSVVFIADAVKMYRQILVDPQDWPYQQILWRFDDADAIQRYSLCTVTYGLSCAPFLALRTLQQLRLDEGDKFPLASQVLLRDIYIDDFVTGASTVDDALILQRQVIDLMLQGGFTLGKWASNRSELLREAQSTSTGTTISEVSWDNQQDPSIKVLGLKWDPLTDCFLYNVKPPPTILSKRGILSTAARVFDPLGFISPSVFLMKSFIQELWKLGLGWDDDIPSSLASDWEQLLQELERLSRIKIPRFVASTQPFQYQIVGFCDASLKGYCGVLYIRTMTNNSISSQLLVAKTKLAPVKSISIPRLELCGAYLLAKLYASIKGFLSLLPSTDQPPRFFSDSTIVLGWLKTPTYRLKTFVGNRVSQIAELTDLSRWSHVDTDNNPGDCGSRGCLPKDLIEHSIWWSGPPWLCQPEQTWPSINSFSPQNLPELKSDTISVLVSTKLSLHTCISWMARISSYEKLIRIVAILNRAMVSRYSKTMSLRGISSVEFKDAELVCIRAIQRYFFFDGYDPDISKISSKLSSLNPFLDVKGIVRVGGRLSNSKLPESRKFQILLPSQAHFSHILVDHYHKVFLHPGPNLQQALIQMRFWIPGARKLIRHRTFMCLKCYKSRAKCIFPMMGDLPSYRVEGGRAFLHVGVDFAGPFTIRESHRRKAPRSKAYLCLYVCMTTKALHLEIVSNQSTDAFLASFARLISRRGYPTDVYSDCGSNFKGAARELNEFVKWFREERSENTFEAYSSSRGVKWHFNPPYSPHFGGLWEAGVKAVKRHLYLAAGNAVLTFEELGTLFCKIEAILNSRPLCPLSSDPAEADYLTPGHFLIGSHLSVNPEPSLLDTQDNRLNRWQFVKKISEQIWQRWSLEYLATLQARNKWRKPTDNLRKGDLVLIKSADTPVLQWPTAKVLEVHPGHDGAVRVVTLKTANSTYKRTVANLIPLLPLNQSSQPLSS